MPDLKHEFSWSVSRRGAFEDCARRYYYDYYASWGGWLAGALEQRRRAYRLKKMTRLPMLAGEAVHRALAAWFGQKRAGGAARKDEVRTHALELLRGGYKESRDGAWRSRGGKGVRLAEHHYAEECADEPSGRAKEYGQRFVKRVETAIDWFFSAPELARVRESDPADWLACEEFGTIELFRTKVHAVPDFALRVRQDGPVHVRIYDWKSGGERPEHAFQLALYALYAEQRWGADPAQVRCAAAYLEEGRVVEHRFGSNEIEEALGQTHGSITELRALHFDADQGLGDPQAFPMLPENSPEARRCLQCNYRELCGRG